MITVIPFFKTRASVKLEPALRGPVLARELLESRGAELGEFHSQTLPSIRGARLKQRFRENCRVLNEAYFEFAEASRNEEGLPAGAEWLLDNFHVVDEQVRDIRRDLPRNYYRSLPKLSSGEFLGFPRVYQIVCDYISHTDSKVERESLTHFVQSYQQKVLLTIGEIWALPIMLRLGLVENLRRLAEAGQLSMHYRRQAEQVCSYVLDKSEEKGAELLMSLVEVINQDPEVLTYGASHILRRFKARGSGANLCLQWIHEKLAERGIDANELARLDQHAQSRDQLSVGNCITSLKTVGSLNWRDWFEEVSAVHNILLGDPSGIYAKSDFITRDILRQKIEKLARKLKLSEAEIAAQLLDFTRREIKERERLLADGRETESSVKDFCYNNPAYYLIDEGDERFEASLGLSGDLPLVAVRKLKKAAPLIYISSIAVFTISLVLLALVYSVSAGCSPLWLFIAAFCFAAPISELAIHLVHWLATKSVTPKPLPKLEFAKGLPKEIQAAVVVQSIFGSSEAVDKAVEALEIRYIGNKDPQLSFGILADFSDSKTPILSGDQGILKRAQEGIKYLQGKYPGDKFFILFRERRFNSSQNVFMGWERKRGKIEEFNKFILGAEDTSFKYLIGDTAQLREVKYVVTLDGDTRLPPGVAAKLIGTIAHPLNRAVYNAKTEKVERGYGIIQPRVGITLQSAQASEYAEIFSGHSGLDPYTLTVSDVYQDLFREGSYIGKGVYDVAAFDAATAQRFPDNALLSHDLIEGIFARCGLASDIEVFDDFPQRYHAQAKRQHRWIRGDWQLLPWVGARTPRRDGKKEISPFSLISWWKLFDNLRRSLVVPSVFIGLLAIFSTGPANVWVWLIGFSLIWGFPLLTLFYRAVFDIPWGYSLRSFYRGIYLDFKKNLKQFIYGLSFVPHQALSSLHAITVTVYRVYISRKNLLEWETAQAAEQRLGGSLADFVSSMSTAWHGLLIGLLAFAGSERSAGVLVPGLFFILGLVSPLLAWYLSRPRKTQMQELDTSERVYLRGVAYATWKYFRSFLKAEYNYLIPDNLQIVPQSVVAERTSPTNISLSTLSVFSAYDLGFIPLTEAIQKLSRIFDTLESLERFQGHFLNWYSITDLRPLPPRYVSAVDSGNLVGHFVALGEAFRRIEHAPVIKPEHVAFLSALMESEKTVPPEYVAHLKLCETRVETLAGVLQYLSALKVALERCTGLTEDLNFARQEMQVLEGLLAWTSGLKLLKQLCTRDVLPKKFERVEDVLLARRPSLLMIEKLVTRLLKVETLLDRSALRGAEIEELETFLSNLKSAKAGLGVLSAEIGNVRKSCNELVEEADFGFLFDSDKKLFVIGYNVDAAAKDNSYYDLLASEARLASLIAVAKGDIPQTHWFLLSRALTQSAGGKALISWSGTMFEYLMPLLVNRDYPSTLLGDTYKTVVRAQRFYAMKRGIPWGISESAYSGVDFEKTYQYKAFGIPGLGLKRGLAEDLVVSPYSTAMALMVDPASAIDNLRRLEQDGVRGDYGFYEAVDYTAERLGAEEDCHVVKSFLAHHQGMSLISINNLLNGNIFQERFHANVRIKAHELLLQERFPGRIPVIVPHQAELLSLKRYEGEAKVDSTEYFSTPYTRHPFTRILSNRKYTLLLDNAGAGASIYNSSVSVSRFKEDGLNPSSGTFIYVKDVDSGEFWSAAYQPTTLEPESYEAVFNLDKIEYKRRDSGISLHTEITVSPEDNVEVRRLSVTNLSEELRNLELSSFGEVAIAASKADAAHPAFSKMFVQSEYLEDYDALLFVRKARSEHDKEYFMMHMVSMPMVWAPTQYETSRELFIGRGGSLAEPQAIVNAGKLSGTVGTVLDPIFSLRSVIEVEPASTVLISYITGIAESREEILELVKKYRELSASTRAFELAWSHSDVEIRHQQLNRSSILDFQRLANAILYNIESLRASQELVRRSSLSQTALWRFGISGDEPIVLLVVTDPAQLKLAEELIFAHEYLRHRGIRFDLVILNEYQSGYFQDLQDSLQFAVRVGVSPHLINERGGVFLRAIGQLSEEEVSLLHGSSRVIIHGSRGTLSSQLNFVSKNEADLVPERQLPAKGFSFVTPELKGLKFPNSWGGFSADGREYQMLVTRSHLPPQPWSNVVANKNFGFLATESGGGYTWADNSRENRLTSWSNDPVCDPPSEVIYLRDQESGNFWNPTPGPVKLNYPVKVTHGAGYTNYETEVNQIESKLNLTVPLEEPVKWWNLELSNKEDRPRTIEVFLYVEWVLGVTRQDNYRFQRSGFVQDKKFIYVTNPFNIDFGNQYIFLGSNLKPHSFTGSRREFLGRLRDVSSPIVFENHQGVPGFSSRLGAGKSNAITLSGSVGTGFDSAGVLKVTVQLAPREKQQLLFYLAKANSLAEAENESVKYSSLVYRNKCVEQVREHWAGIFNTVQLETPDEKLNILVNSWLPYQTLSCRMLARTGFYQSSGAIGFRDQLQDSLCFLLSKPELAREQILLHASRQFVEGDVQHWWHPPQGRGIRTRISDNYLWLPYVVDKYIEQTGDRGILDVEVPFLEGPQLEVSQHDLYLSPQVSQVRASLYEHCLRALERSYSLGVHGLCLMGGGDWNDGMNLVGVEGRGESVWLSWFTATVLKSFSSYVETRGESERALKYRAQAAQLVESIESHAWDGEWYCRAFFDDGTPLGTAKAEECRIDAIAQSWSVISGMAKKERQLKALESVSRHLFDRERQIIKLLTPPFKNHRPNPGYIQSYPAGLRENGGQYTHGVVWTLISAAMLGQGDLAQELFNCLNPISHGDSEQASRVYKNEPYVTSGDVYSSEQHPARGGWSWYTGSSGWLYRAAVENICGLRVRGNMLSLDPCVPKSWKEFALNFNYRGKKLRIEVKNPNGVERGVEKLMLNGEELSTGELDLQSAESVGILTVIMA